MSESPFWEAGGKCCVRAKLQLYSITPVWRASLALQNKVTVHPKEQVKLLTQTSGLKSFLGACVYRADILISQGHHQSLQRWRGDSMTWWEEWGSLLVTVFFFFKLVLLFLSFF